MSEIKLGITQSRGYEEAEAKTISSREVAEMMEEPKHSNVIRKIEQINVVLTNSKVSSLSYWIESTYKDAKGEVRKEYQVTKRGCEMLAHKSTGEKGIIFTHKYMERFNQMEKALVNPYAHLSQELQAVIAIDIKQQVLEREQQVISERLTQVEENAPLSPSEYGMVSQKISNKIHAVKQELGNNLSRRQKSELYKAINREIKVITGVSHRCQLRQKHLDLVLDFIRTWEPSRATIIVINQLNLFDEAI